MRNLACSAPIRTMSAWAAVARIGTSAASPPNAAFAETRSPSRPRPAPPTGSRAAPAPAGGSGKAGEELLLLVQARPAACHDRQEQTRLHLRPSDSARAWRAPQGAVLPPVQSAKGLAPPARVVLVHRQLPALLEAFRHRAAGRGRRRQRAGAPGSRGRAAAYVSTDGVACRPAHSRRI